jgi:glycosyltransferase involved in cell wall biosynthesis
MGSVSLFVADGKGDESWNGIRIRDIGKSGAGRLGRALGGNYRMWKAIRAAKPDLVHFHDPELLPLLFVLYASGTRVVYDMHENLPKEILTKPWVSPPVRRVVSFLTRIAQRLSSRKIPTVFAETSYAKDFPSTTNAAVVLNYPLVDELIAITTPKREHFAVGYMGGISTERGALVVLNAVERLRHQGIDIEAVFVGPVAPEPAVEDLLERGIKAGWLSVTGRVPPATAWALMAQCHVGVAILQPSANFVDSYPTKLFEHMALSEPVIISDFPLWRDVVDRAKCGLLVDPTNVEALAKAICALFENPDEGERMGERGRAAVIENYRWETQFAELKKLYLRILPAASA